MIQIWNKTLFLIAFLTTCVVERKSLWIKCSIWIGIKIFNLRQAWSAYSGRAWIFVFPVDDLRSSETTFFIWKFVWSWVRSFIYILVPKIIFFTIIFISIGFQPAWSSWFSVLFQRRIEERRLRKPCCIGTLRIRNKLIYIIPLRFVKIGLQLLLFVFLSANVSINQTWKLKTQRHHIKKEEIEKSVVHIVVLLKIITNLCIIILHNIKAAPQTHRHAQPIRCQKYFPSIFKIEFTEVPLEL